jgi:hypothetical protein
VVIGQFVYKDLFFLPRYLGDVLLCVFCVPPNISAILNGQDYLCYRSPIGRQTVAKSLSVVKRRAYFNATKRVYRVLVL